MFNLFAVRNVAKSLATGAKFALSDYKTRRTLHADINMADSVKRVCLHIARRSQIKREAHSLCDKCGDSPAPYRYKFCAYCDVLLRFKH